MRLSALIKATVLGVTALASAITLSNAQAVPITWNDWTFDYEIGVNKVGLALKKVKYKNRVLLKKVSLASIGVNFNSTTSCGLFNDHIDGATSPMPWAGNATLSQRQFTHQGREWYEIGIYKKIAGKSGMREYFQAYYLSKDGLFDAHLYSKGGWECPTGSRMPFWRVDADVDGSARDVIEHSSIDYTTKEPVNSGIFRTFKTEFNEVNSGIWRFRDKATNAYLIAMPHFNFSHPGGNDKGSYVDAALQFEGRLYRAREDLFSLGGYPPSVSHDNINDQDVVATIFRGAIWQEISKDGWGSTGISLVPSWAQTSSDLIVDSTTYSGGSFFATIRNLGSATPSGKVIRVGFSVDGKYKTYVSTTKPMLPGELRSIKTPAQVNRLYNIPAGSRNVSAWVDDVNRIAEAYDVNNKFTAPILRRPTVKITAPAKNATVSGSAVNVSATAADPIALSTGVEFLMDDKTIDVIPEAPYNLVWNSTKVSSGYHVLTARALNTVGFEGRESIIIKVVPTTFKPDLVVASLNYANGKFSCTIKNQGAGTVPSGAKIGISYLVDGKKKTWTTTFGPLAAGALVNLNVSKGGLYTIPSGSHTIKVIADDQSSVVESNETNNQLSQTITVP